MTTDERLHFIGGYLKAKWMSWTRLQSYNTIIYLIDMWAFEREWEQNLEGKNPNVPMSDHQLREARAWGLGARRCLGIEPSWPDCYERGRP